MSADVRGKVKALKSKKMWVLYYVFRFMRAIYTAVYFYFFPMFVSFVPIYELLFLKEKPATG